MDKNFGSMGWERDRPDYRDYTVKTLEVKKSLALFNKRRFLKRPDCIDLRAWCFLLKRNTPGQCTIKTALMLPIYFEARVFGKKTQMEHINPEQWQDLLDYPGDRGTYLRSAIKAIVEHGLPVHYYRLDPPGTSPDRLLTKVRSLLASGLPFVFGFSVFSSFPQIGDCKGNIRFPKPHDYLEGGLAAVAAGYNDRRQIGTDKGALLIFIPWGVEWGEKGYGWLPYSYIKAGLAVDFWSIISTEYACCADF